MSWFRIKTKRGVLKIKPRAHLRFQEQMRRVPVLDLGLVIISWWPDEVPFTPHFGAQHNVVDQHLGQKLRLNEERDAE